MSLYYTTDRMLILSQGNSNDDIDIKKEKFTNYSYYDGGKVSKGMEGRTWIDVIVLDNGIAVLYGEHQPLLSAALAALAAVTDAFATASCRSDFSI